MALSVGEATQAARTFQQMASAATTDADVAQAVAGLTTKIQSATGGAELTGSDMQALQRGFESLGLGASDFQGNVGLSRAFHYLVSVPAYSVLSGLDALQHADREITFNIQGQSVHRDAPPPPPPVDLAAVVAVAQGDSDRGRPLSGRELDALTGMRAFGHEDFGGEEGDRMFGQNVTRLNECACFSWALSGASDSLVDPAPIFGMLGNNGLMRSIDEHRGDVRDAPTQAWLAKDGNREAIEAIKEDIIDLEVDTDEAIKRVTQLMIEANGMEVVEESDFAICMEYSSSDSIGVNFTHWGIQFMGQTLETNPGVGFWKTNDTFAENWTEDDGSTKVVTIPVKSFTPAHHAVIRDVLEFDPEV